MKRVNHFQESFAIVCHHINALFLVRKVFLKKGSNHTRDMVLCEVEVAIVWFEKRGLGGKRGGLCCYGIFYKTPFVSLPLF